MDSMTGVAKGGREQVAEFRKLVAIGKDPITARDMAVEANIKAATVEDCIKSTVIQRIRQPAC